MPFSRALGPESAPSSEALTSAMVGIGMLFAAPAAREPNIEDTLFFASVEGMEQGDLRVLSLLTTWFGLHAPWVNADRLIRLVRARGSPRVRVFWSALAHWQARDRRFARFASMGRGATLDLLPTGTDFQIRRHGEDARFAGSALRVPAQALRDRQEDVLPPEELARHHRAYHYRVLMGPTYRADMWAALESAPDLSAAELARRTYGSFATAWHVQRDFSLLRPPPAPPARKPVLLLPPRHR